MRALIVQDGRLLLVNAYREGDSDLWCAPGGGVELHGSLHDNLMREVHEETGLTVHVGDLAGVNEFHDPAGSFHQVEIFFHARIAAGALDPAWRDLDQIVSKRHFFSPEEMRAVRYKPDALARMAFDVGTARYDPLERIVR
ncbi:MAG: NUDIX domain-containing protein [Pseudomonadota bacterium]